MVKIISLAIVLATITYVLVFATTSVINLTQKSIDIASTHQIATALEMYYYDHDSYPKANQTSELLELLKQENYIKQFRTNGGNINYSVSENGQSYQLIGR